VMHVHMIFMPRVAMGGNVRMGIEDWGRVLRAYLNYVHNLFATNIFCICPYFSIESKIILDVSCLQQLKRKIATMQRQKYPSAGSVVRRRKRRGDRGSR